MNFGGRCAIVNKLINVLRNNPPPPISPPLPLIYTLKHLPFFIQTATNIKFSTLPFNNCFGSVLCRVYDFSSAAFYLYSASLTMWFVGFDTNKLADIALVALCNAV